MAKQRTARAKRRAKAIAPATPQPAQIIKHGIVQVQDPLVGTSVVFAQNFRFSDPPTVVLTSQWRDTGQPEQPVQKPPTLKEVRTTGFRFTCANASVNESHMVHWIAIGEA